MGNYSREFYRYRDNLIKQYENVNKDLYNQLIKMYKANGVLDIANNYDIIYRLYINERVEDADIAKLCGLSDKGMRAKRLRLGIPDRPSKFNVTLQMTDIALRDLGYKV